ncbi:hypothetical protein O6H91_08G085000 [Diphasiastrum complanatum]|uniref:Uncharacterized protein n=1 Tax=Diphasiastrum complanatum TaxID=34168 RepID=A0ACC2CZW7_DIPCM|nr:hypothetical protein O6H91_08G085000 [Diphasiastrum complanatum]
MWSQMIDGRVRILSCGMHAQGDGAAAYCGSPGNLLLSRNDGEQSATPLDFPRTLGPSSTVPCRVIAVNLLANAETNEVYAHIRLQSEGTFAVEEDEACTSQQHVENPTSFAKTLRAMQTMGGDSLFLATVQRLYF